MSASTASTRSRDASLGRRGPIVAFQGERGAYADLALDEVWGSRVRRVPCGDFGAVATAVASGVADYGVLPVWNAIIGAIPGVAEVLARTPLTVEREVVVPIVHCVLAPPGATLDGLRAVFSHPAAIGQCRRFFAARPGVTPAECYDTAGAARDVAARRRFDEGAIAGEHCAARYGLAVLAREVGDRPDNWTRFAVLSRPMMTTKDFRA